MRRHSLYIGDTLVRKFWTLKGARAVAAPLGRQLSGLVPERMHVKVVSERWIGN